MQVSSRASGVPPARAWILGAVLIPPNLYLVLQAEAVFPVSTLFTIFYNVTFTVVLLTAMNAVVRAVAPKAALRSSELLVIFTMLSIGTGIFGHDMLNVLIHWTASASWFPTKENDWANVFILHIPSWLLIEDRPALRPFFEGQSTVYSMRVVRAWLVPALWWSTFIAVLLFVTLAMVVIIRRQWTEREKLAYPIIQLPLELATGQVAFLSRPALWIGFGLAGGLDVYNVVAAYMPALPRLQPFISVAATSRPWSAVGATPVAAYPFVIGLAYFLPLDLSFSAWFFHVAWKAELAARNVMSVWSTPGPYRSFQTGGSWIVLTALVSWTGRRHLIRVFRVALGLGRPGEDDDEPLRYGTAVFGAIAGIACLVLMMVYMGMSAWFALSFLAIYLIYMIAIIRIRAESGPPSADAEMIGPEQLLLNALGGRAVGRANTALSSTVYWMSRAWRSVPVGHQMEGFKMAQVVGAPSRTFLIAMVIASIVGSLSGFWMFLHVVYEHGVGAANSFGIEPFRRLEGWILNPRDPSLEMMWEMSVGAVVTTVLMVLHHRFLWFPFHPVGYAIAAGWVMYAAWFSIFVAWALKLIILRTGGPRLYRKFVPFFVGLIMGQHVVGGFWTLLGGVSGQRMYQFFPYKYLFFS